MMPRAQKNIGAQHPRGPRRRTAAVIKKAKAGPGRAKARCDIQRLLSELQVHQVELEVQNEELISAKCDVEQSRNKYLDLYDFAPVGYFTLDDRGLMRDVNNAGCVLLGLVRKDALNRIFHLFLPAGERDRFWRFLKNVFASGVRQSAELLFIDKDDIRRCLQVEAVTAHDAAGPVPCALLAVMDVTKQKRAEEILRGDKAALEQLARDNSHELVAMTRAMERSKRLSDIGVLAATIAHEMRNPLAAMKAALFNIRRKNREPALAAHLVTLDKKISESAQVIENLLNYSRIQLPDFTAVDMLDMVKECLAAMQGKYAHGQVSVEEKYAASIETVIEADPVQIKMLFSNILDNAYQSLPDNKGALLISLRSPDAGTLEIAVQDNGIGISEEDQGRIFDPFFTRKSKGTGLGLYVCRQLAELHNGSITMRSSQGVGSRFAVVLPIRQRCRQQ